MNDAVVLQTAWLGDAVLTTPLLTAAARRHAGVDVMTTPAAAPLLETHPAVRDVLLFDKRGADRGPAGLLRTAALLRARRYAAAYHPQPSLRSALLAWLAGIPHRVGFADAPGQLLYTQRVPRDRNRHEAERLVALVDPDAPTALTLALTAGDRAAAEAALREARVTTPFVALAPGSARPTKRWPHYEALAARLADDIPVLWLDPSRPIRTSAAILARAAAAVTNDSAPLHMAQAVGTPTVAIFGPTAPELGFGPRGPQDRTIGLDLDCRPCSLHGGPRCPLEHHGCMRELPVGTVLTAIHEVLADASSAHLPSPHPGAERGVV